MIITHALLAINSKGELLHFCGYEGKPTEIDIKNLDTELREDKEFGLVNEEFIVIHAPDEMIAEVFGTDNDTDNWNEEDETK